MRSNLIRTIALIALILGEGLLLGIVYDSDSLTQLPAGWWTGILSMAGRVMPLTAAIATGCALLGGRKIAARFPASSFRPRIGQFIFFLVLQLVSFGGLYLVTGDVFGPIDSVMRHPGPWVAVWISSAGITGILWLCTLVPIQTIAAIMRQSWRLLAGCIGIGVAAYLLGVYTQNWWKPLRGFTLNSAYWFLRLGDSSAWVNPGRYEIGAGPTFGVEIARQCSGYEGIGLIWVFLLGYFYFYRKELRFPRALLLLPIATIAAWCANTFRIAALVAIGAHASPAIALGGFHSYAGILLVSCIALSAGGIAHRSPIFNRIATKTKSPPNPAAPWLVPFLTVLIVGMATGIFKTGQLDLLYFLRVLAAAAVLLHYFPLSPLHVLRERVWVRVLQFSTPAAIGAAVFVIWISLTAHAILPPQDSGPLALSLPLCTLWIIFRCVGSIVIAPIVEELAFRGYLARRFVSCDFDAVPFNRLSLPAILLSSLAFAAMHGSILSLQFIAAIIAGIAYALMAKRRGKIQDAVIAHAATNALLSIYVLTTHAWSLWG